MTTIEVGKFYKNAHGQKVEVVRLFQRLSETCLIGIYHTNHGCPDISWDYVKTASEKWTPGSTSPRSRGTRCLIGASGGVLTRMGGRSSFPKSLTMVQHIGLERGTQEWWLCHTISASHTPATGVSPFGSVLGRRW